MKVGSKEAHGPRSRWRSRELIGETVYVAKGTHRVQFYDKNGDLLLDHPWPEPGTKHVSNGRTRGAGSRRPKNIAEALHPADPQPEGEYRRTVRADGRVSVRNVVYGLGKDHIGHEVYAIIGKATVTFWSAHTGEHIAEHPLPEPGVKHVGYVRYNRTATTSNKPPDPEVSTMS